MSIHHQIESLIADVARPIVEHGVQIVSPAYIADEVDRRIDPDGIAPTEKTYATRMYLRHEVRKFLARNYDPVERTRAGAIDAQSDLFADVLQDYYPVKRHIGDEEQLVYTRREYLSQADATRLAERMKRGGESLIKHAEALIAYVIDREAA